MFGCRYRRLKNGIGPQQYLNLCQFVNQIDWNHRPRKEIIGSGSMNRLNMKMVMYHLMYFPLLVVLWGCLIRHPSGVIKMGQQKHNPKIVLAAYIFSIQITVQSNAWLSWKGSRRLKFGRSRPTKPSSKLEFLEEIVYCPSMTIHSKLTKATKLKSKFKASSLKVHSGCSEKNGEKSFTEPAIQDLLWREQKIGFEYLT